MLNLEKYGYTLHRYLQLKAVEWLFFHGCRYAATEVENEYARRDYWQGFFDDELASYAIQPTNGLPRFVFDALGLKYDRKWIITGIEVKTSNSDLAKGFCIGGANKVYVLVPWNLNTRIVPKVVGILKWNPKTNEIVCVRGAKYKETTADVDIIKERILERTVNEVRFHLLKLSIRLLEASSNESD